MYTKTNQNTRNSTNIFSPIRLNGINEFYEIEPGEVLDIILDNNHPEFESYEDIGKAKIRLLYSQTDSDYYDPNKLSWVKPLNINNSSFPLLHEIVLCAHYVSRETSNELSGPLSFPVVLYYDTIVNTINSCIHNSLLDISLSSNYKNSKQYISPDSLKLGSTFIGKLNIHPLKHLEGDIIYQGRTGNSIRLGSERGIGKNPILKIRNKQYDEADNLNDNLEIIEENINDDGSSIWLTSEDPIDIKLSNDKTDSLIKFPSILNGNQILLNSDRVIVNSKINEILLFSNKDILLSARNEVGINANERTVISSPHIYLGSNKATEPLILGNQLFLILYEILVQLVSLTVTNAAGSSSPPNNSKEFINIMKKLNKILSKRNYTS